MLADLAVLTVRQLL